jgi:hypothetical protein
MDFKILRNWTIYESMTICNWCQCPKSPHSSPSTESLQNYLNIKAILTEIRWFFMFWRFLFHIDHIWFPPKILEFPGISPFFLAQETFKKVLSEVDIAISTAAIPGRRQLKFFRQPPKWPPDRPKLVELDAKIFHKWWRTILFCIFFDEVVGWYGVNGYQQTSDDMMTWIWLGWRWDFIL